MSEEILIPKDSVEILNELKPGITIATEMLQSSETVMASVKINGNTYVEYEKTEYQAKQAVAERVLKDLFFEQIKSTLFNDDDFQYNYTHSWKLLGSLAMSKLIENWLTFYMSNNKYKDAFEIFVPTKIELSKNFSQNNNVKVNKNDCMSKKQDSIFKSDQEKTTEKKKQQSVNKKNTFNVSNKIKSPNLLANKIITDDTNPCAVLNELIKSIKFIDFQPNTDKPPFKFSVILDNIEYKSDPAGSKKEAKQNVAKKILMKKFGYLQV